MKKSQKGFTIIEVALVLAIGSLIFMTVFLAVPALQRNQRNDARKRDVANIVQAVASYNANNARTGMSTLEDVYYIDPSGSVAKNLDDEHSLGRYLDTLSTNISHVNVKDAGTGKQGLDAEGASTINVYKGSRCNADGNDIEETSGRMSAVLGVMEEANNMYTYYCQDAS